jgi:ABC-2 type transport system ATP-binding protein
MLIIENLTHVYGNGVRALDEVSLTIPRGMYGLLGPNGAGKSTLMRTIATLQAPTSGHIRFGDIDVLKTPELLRAPWATCRRTSASIRASRPTTCSTTWRC